MDYGTLMVNVADPDDVRGKLGEARLKLSEIDAERLYWTDLVRRLEVLAGDEQPSGLAPSQNGRAVIPSAAPVEGRGERAPSSDKPAPGHMQELVVGIIQREGKELRAKEVTKILQGEGHDVNGDKVRNALWYAAERSGVIERLGRGTYATHAYVEAATKPSAVELAASVAAGAGTGALLAHGLGMLAGGTKG